MSSAHLAARLPQDESLTNALLYNENATAVNDRLWAYFFGGSASSASLWSIVWSPAPINWCEDDYVYLPHIAEFWNTISNISFILAGIYIFRFSSRYGLAKHFHVLALMLFLTGVFSALFHATLTWLGQKTDELAESLTCVFLVHCQSHSIRVWTTAVHSAITTLGIFLVSGFLFCEVHLLGMAFMLNYRMVTSTSDGFRSPYLLDLSPSAPSLTSPQSTVSHSNSSPKFLQHLKKIRIHSLVAVTYAVISFSAWLVDRLACETYGKILPLHAVWHIVMGAALHIAACAAVAMYGRKKGEKMSKDKPYSFSLKWQYGLSWLITAEEEQQLQQKLREKENQKKK